MFHDQNSINRVKRIIFEYKMQALCNSVSITGFLIIQSNMIRYVYDQTYEIMFIRLKFQKRVH